MYSTIPIHLNIKSAPASPGRSRIGQLSTYLASWEVTTHKKFAYSCDVTKHNKFAYSCDVTGAAARDPGAVSAAGHLCGGGQRLHRGSHGHRWQVTAWPYDCVSAWLLDSMTARLHCHMTSWQHDCVIAWPIGPMIAGPQEFMTAWLHFYLLM